jgi:hypothetical protein
MIEFMYMNQILQEDYIFQDTRPTKHALLAFILQAQGRQPKTHLEEAESRKDLEAPWLLIRPREHDCHFHPRLLSSRESKTPRREKP